MSAAETPTELGEASDPTTAPARLAALAAHPESSVREAVARNPSTPSGALRSLIEERWEDVASNPALPLMVVADPGWFDALSEGAIAAILRSPATTPDWFTALSARPDILIVALDLGRIEAVEGLLAAGADPNPRSQFYCDGNVHERSALDTAVDGGLDRAVTLLLLTGKMHPLFRAYCLRTAMVHGHAAVVRAFLPFQSFDSPLVDAASRGEVARVRAQRRGAPDRERRDALGVATLLGHDAAARALLEARAPVGGLTSWSRTPLWYAVHAGQARLVRALLDAGASPQERSWHETPLQEAEKSGQDEIVRLLRARPTARGWHRARKR